MKKTMQKSRKRLGALALATAMMLGALPLTAAAPNQVTTVTGEMRPQVSVMVDGVERDFYNAQGQQVYAVFYDGTHYLPVRAIGELMGKNVNWDQSTLTISLTAPRTTGTVQGTPGTAAQAQSIQMENRPDFTILVEGEKKSFKDAQGHAVYPMLYQGTTYLPVRAIGELMGKNVSWNSQSAVITLGSSSGSLVTDADSFEQGGSQGNQQNPTTGYNIKGDPAGKIDLESLCRAMGFERVRVVDPYDLKATDQAVKEELAAREPSVIISRRPCALLKYVKHKAPLAVNKDKCIGCKSCMKIGCPAISMKEGKAHVDFTQCVGCGVCEQLCPVGAFESTGKEG